MMDRWKRHLCGWLYNGKNNPLHIVKFEELKTNTIIEMSKIVSFYGGTRMSNAMIASIKDGYNVFRRNHTDTFHHFTAAQEEYVVNTIQKVIDTLERHYNHDSSIINILRSYLSAN
jgi:hypothetical protein